MKPNGSRFAVRSVILTLCAVSLLSTFGSAESLRGSFTLTAETHWGELLLPPGAYELTGDTGGKMVTIRSKESGWSGMTMAEGTSDAKPDEGTKLVVTKSEVGSYVRALCLGDAGITFIYGAPKAGKTIRLTAGQPGNTTIASAASTQR
jgi:hypothetical protein